MFKPFSIHRFQQTLLIGAGTLACALLALKIWNAPLFDWNGRRLVASIAALYGYRVFNPLSEFVGISGLNGPVFLWAFFPAALASTPDGATRIGVLCAALLVLVPAGIWLLRTQPKRKSPATYLGSLIFLVLLTFFSKALSYSAYMVHADSPSIACCTFALLFTYVWLENRKKVALVAASMCAVLAFFSKITFLPICAALPFYVWMVAGTRAALVLSAGITGSFGVIGFVLSWRYGFSELYAAMYPIQNNVVSTLGSTSDFSHTLFGRAKVSIAALIEIFSEYFPILLGISVLAATQKNWIRLRALLPFVVAVVMIPAAIAGRTHAGGAINTQSPTAFFLILAFVTLLCETRFSESERSRATAQTVFFSFLALISVVHVYTLYSLVSPLPTLPTNPQKVAFEYAKKHPEEVYFPDYPLASLLAEKKLYHSGQAIAEFLGSFHFSDEALRQRLPSKMRHIVFNGEPYGDFSSRFPEFTRVTEISDLPNWKVLEKRN